MISNYDNFKHDYRMVIYHFTTIRNLYDILKGFESMIILDVPYSDRISFTRNYNMKSRELRIDKRCCRIAVDYNKLKDKYKIKPFFDEIYKDDSEQEERVYKLNNEFIDITSSIIQIDILSKPVFDDSLTGALNSYFFGDNLYLHKQVDVINKYYEYLDKIKTLNITKIPIYIVDNYSIIK